MADLPGGLGRTPPDGVKLLLRTEVGYGCPVDQCASPYLEYHHFDPPWATEHHHRPEGMIALCGLHHPKADGGSYTTEQLRDLKRSSFALTADVRGRFDWRRRDLIARVGGNFFVRTPTMVQVAGHEVVTQRYDEEGMLLLSVGMLSTSPEPRLRMVDHEWHTIGSPTAFESPPSGRRIHAEYSNGDRLTIEFWEAHDASAFGNRYATSDGAPLEVPESFDVQFPVAIAEVTMEVGGSDISFGKDSIRVGTNQLINNWSGDSKVGFSLQVPNHYHSSTAPPR